MPQRSRTADGARVNADGATMRRAVRAVADGARDLIGAPKVLVTVPHDGQPRAAARRGFSPVTARTLADAVAGLPAPRGSATSGWDARDPALSVAVRNALEEAGCGTLVVAFLGTPLDPAETVVLIAGFTARPLPAAAIRRVARYATVVAAALDAEPPSRAPAIRRGAGMVAAGDGHAIHDAMAIPAGRNDWIDDERRRLLTLIDTLPDGLMIVQRDGHVRLFNQAAMAILGDMPEPVALTGETSGGAPYQSVTGPVGNALEGHPIQGEEVVLTRSDGVEVPLLVSTRPLPGPSGDQDAAVIVFQDISRLKELDRLKDEFINTVSHELRTPTTTIRGGALTLLRRGGSLDQGTRRQLLQDMADESERLHHLVEDLLSLSRSRSGMRIEAEPLRLHRLVNRFLADHTGLTAGAAVTLSLPLDLPLVDADPLVMEQVLRNLLGNAVRHTPPGSPIEITATATGQSVTISVLDRGEGIDPEDLTRVFEPFYRPSATVHAATRGAGLGLAVCRRLVEMSGGHIWAERREGGGSAFRFTLPLAMPDTDA